MKYNKIDDAIESVNNEKKTEMRAQLHARLGIQVCDEKPIKRRRRFFDYKAIAFGSIGLCAVCLAIILPIAFRDTAPNKQDRYKYTSSELSHSDLGYNVKEYAELLGKNLLYVDWYDIADDCITSKYFLPNDENNIIYISEDLCNGETGDHVRMLIIENSIDIDAFEFIKESCGLTFEYNNILIKWSYDTAASQAYFEYDGYEYIMRLFEPTEREAILDIVKDMLQKKL